MALHGDEREEILHVICIKWTNVANVVAVAVICMSGAAVINRHFENDKNG